MRPNVIGLNKTMWDYYTEEPSNYSKFGQMYRIDSDCYKDGFNNAVEMLLYSTRNNWQKMAKEKFTWYIFESPRFTLEHDKVEDVYYLGLWMLYQDIPDELAKDMSDDYMWRCTLDNYYNVRKDLERLGEMILDANE